MTLINYEFQKELISKDEINNEYNKESLLSGKK